MRITGLEGRGNSGEMVGHGGWLVECCFLGIYTADFFHLSSQPVSVCLCHGESSCPNAPLFSPICSFPSFNPAPDQAPLLSGPPIWRRKDLVGGLMGRGSLGEEKKSVTGVRANGFPRRDRAGCGVSLWYFEVSRTVPPQVTRCSAETCAIVSIGASLDGAGRHWAYRRRLRDRGRGPCGASVEGQRYWRLAAEMRGYVRR